MNGTTAWIRPGWSFVVLVGVTVPGCLPLVPIALAAKVYRLAAPFIWSRHVER